MIDIHCHIIPEIDDGPKGIDSSLEMARNAVEQGITTIVATPHCNRRYDTDKISINDKVTLLNSKLVENHIPLKIIPGQEIRLAGGIVDGLNSEELQPLGDSKYILLELPSRSVPCFTDKLIYNLLSEGYIPVIAHPERNEQIMKDPNILYKFVNEGALAQLTAGSISGVFGKKLKKLSEDLIDANLIHFVASDAHPMPNRGFFLEDAFNEIEKAFGEDCVDYLKENAELLVKGEDISTWMPEKVRRKKFLGIF